MALAPAQVVDPATVVITVAVAASLCGLAMLLLGRRDIRSN
jgi:hypothetical protein